jgi:hypothetical protein
MTVTAIGIPTLPHWLWTRRSRPLVDSYSRVLLYFARWFGTAYAVLAAALLVIASTDLLLGRGFYPLWSIPLIAALVGIGLFVRWMAGLWLTPSRE